jgi:hypothetical protein
VSLDIADQSALAPAPSSRASFKGLQGVRQLEGRSLFVFANVCLVAALGLLADISAQAAQLHSIYWLSDSEPCHGLVGVGMPGPVVSSSYPPCTLRGIKISICRNTVPTVDNDQWQAGGPITVLGYSVGLWLSQSDAGGSLVVGQAGGNGPDVFAILSTVGTRSITEWLPPGDGISIPDNSTLQGKNAHFDIYAGCEGTGKFQALVSIYYASP